MRVIAYEDGEAEGAERYKGMSPEAAALRYAKDGIDQDINVIVEPEDEEAGDLPGWTLRPDGARVMLFEVRTTTVATKVDAFLVPS